MLGKLWSLLCESWRDVPALYIDSSNIEQLWQHITIDNEHKLSLTKGLPSGIKHLHITENLTDRQWYQLQQAIQGTNITLSKDASVEAATFFIYPITDKQINPSSINKEVDYTLTIPKEGISLSKPQLLEAGQKSQLKGNKIILPDFKIVEHSLIKALREGKHIELHLATDDIPIELQSLTQQTPCAIIGGTLETFNGAKVTIKTASQLQQEKAQQQKLDLEILTWRCQDAHHQTFNNLEEHQQSL